MIFDIPKQLMRELNLALQSKQADELSQSQLRSLLEAVIRKCQLVSREEFDAQQAVLLRTREKLEMLEGEVEALRNQAK